MFGVIVNPVSGGREAAGLAVQITERIAALGEESRIFETGGDGDAAAQTRAALAAGCQSIVCIGGDGTICEVAGELCHTGATFYVVPGGTGNDFARAFHLPKNPMAAFEAQLAGEPVEIDCGRMNGQSFLNVSGSGFDVAVLQKTEELKAVYPGEKAYRKAVLSVLGRYKAFEADVSIDGGAETHEACTIVEIANGQSIGGGMRVAPDAKLDDGYFDVVVGKKVPRMLIPLLLPAFMLGWHTKIGLARVVRAKNVTMRAKGMIVNLDGKLLRADEAKYKILPGAIRMKKPRASNFSKTGLKRRVPSFSRQKETQKEREHDEKTLVRMDRPCAAAERGVRPWRKPVRGQSGDG